jgi:hypothetical protein
MSMSSAVIANGTPEMQAAVVGQAIQLSSKFALLADIWDKEKLDDTATADGIMSDVEGMGTLYTEEMNQNYLKTGNRFEGIIVDDLAYCRELATAAGLMS